MKTCKDKDCCQETPIALMHKDIKTIKYVANVILISILIPIITGIVIGVTVYSANKSMAKTEQRP